MLVVVSVFTTIYFSPSAHKSFSSVLSKATYSTPGIDMADIRGNTGTANDVVQGKLADPRVELQEERQRLSNASR